MPQQVAVRIAIHQAVRSKQLVNMLYGFGLSVEYNRLLRVEAQFESSVLKRMEESNGLFLPPDIVKGRHVFFAIDNMDFAEDTYDGRNTLHGTAMDIYQKSCSRRDTIDPVSLVAFLHNRYTTLIHYKYNIIHQLFLFCVLTHWWQYYFLYF